MIFSIVNLYNEIGVLVFIN